MAKARANDETYTVSLSNNQPWVMPVAGNVNHTTRQEQQRHPYYQSRRSNQGAASANYLIPAPATQAPLNNMLLSGYMSGPQNLASSINSAFDAYQQNVHLAEDRAVQREALDVARQDSLGRQNIANSLIGALLGGASAAGGFGGAGGAGRLTGYQDANSGQYARMPGTGSTGVTVPNLGPANIQAARQVASGAPTPAALPPTVAAGAAPSLQAQYAASAARDGAKNAMDVERQGVEGAANLARAREGTVANLGISNAQFLANLARDDARNRTGAQTQFVRALLSGVLDPSTLNYMA